MKLSRPQIRRVHVQVVDPVNRRRSRTKTYYETDADEIFRALDERARKLDPIRRRQTQTA